MGEGVIDESFLPPKARKAFRAAQAILRCAEISNAFLRARLLVMEELPEGLARELCLDMLETNCRLQILQASAPRTFLRGGVVQGPYRGMGGGMEGTLSILIPPASKARPTASSAKSP